MAQSSFDPMMKKKRVQISISYNIIILFPFCCYIWCFVIVIVMFVLLFC